MKTGSKRTFFYSVMAIGAIGMTGCGGGSEASLLIYHDFDDEAGQSIVSAFEEHYEEVTGDSLDAQIYRQPGGELRVTLELEAGNDAVEPDVVSFSHTELYDLQEQFGMFRELDLEGMDDDAIPEDLRDAVGEGYMVTNAVQPYVFFYNTNNVGDSDVPENWSDILDPLWGGNQLGMGDPETTSGAHLPLWFFAEYLDNEIGPPYGWDFFDSLGELSPRTASSHDAILEYVASGELSGGIMGQAQLVRAMEQGQPIDAVAPEEGVPAFINSSAITESADNPEVAEMYLEWIISAEGQEAIFEAYSAVPSRTDVDTSGLPFEVDVEQVVPVDAAWVSDNRSENINRFRDSVSG